MKFLKEKQFETVKNGLCLDMYQIVQYFEMDVACILPLVLIPLMNCADSLLNASFADWIALKIEQKI